MEKNDRIIKKKNYIYLIIMVLVTVLLTLYICNWVSVSKSSKDEISPLSELVAGFDLIELKEISIEANDVIFYFGNSNNSETHYLENKMLNVIKKNDISENIFYVNVTPYLDNDEYIKIIKDAFPTLENKNIKAPLLIYKSGNVIKYRISNSENITIKDFENLASLIEVE